MLTLDGELILDWLPGAGNVVVRELNGGWAVYGRNTTVRGN